MKVLHTPDGVYLEKYGFLSRAFTALMGFAFLGALLAFGLQIADKMASGGCGQNGQSCLDSFPIFIALIFGAKICFAYWFSMSPVIIRRDGWLVRVFMGRHFSEKIGKIKGMSHVRRIGYRGMPILEAFVEGDNKVKLIGSLNLEEAQVIAKHLGVECVTNT